MAKVLPASELRTWIASILVAGGSLPGEAAQVASNLVMANLSGHDSHGIGMVPRYVDAILEGGLKPNTSMAVRMDGGAMLSIDGQRGYGQIVGVQAMELAIARAKTHGLCLMALAGSHHLGRIGHFAEMAVAEGLVALHFVNVLSRPVVAPWGGGDGRFGTNPCCMGIPLAGRSPFVLDFATSRVAQGKMRVAYNKGEQVPEGYLIDPHGRPTTDPAVVVMPQPGSGGGLYGALMTFGEHKGYGMAVACELLGGALTGSGTWHREPDSARSVVNGMLTILISAKHLGTQEAFDREAAAFVDWIGRGPAAPGVDAVMIAGDPERKARAQRERDGIEVDDGTWTEICASAGKLGMKLS